MIDLIKQFANLYVDLVDRAIDNATLSGKQVWSLIISVPLYLINCAIYGFTLFVDTAQDSIDQLKLVSLVIGVYAVLIPLSCYSCVLALFLTVWFSIFGPSLKPVPVIPEILRSDRYGEHKFAELEGITLHYVDKNDGQKKPIMLFLHGFSEFWFTWRHQIDNFSSSYRTVAVDLRGYGESDKPTDNASYQMDVLIRDLKNFIEFINPEQEARLYVVARGWGAVILYCFLLKHGSLVNAYVTQNMVPSYTYKLTFRQVLNSWEIYLFQVPLIARIFIAAYIPFYIQHTYGILEEDDRDEVIAAYTYELRKAGAYKYPLKYFGANLITLIAYTFRGAHELPSSFMPPGLCLYGQDDRYVDETTFKYVTFVPNLQTVRVLDSGYKMTELKYKTINKLIEIFIRHLKPREDVNDPPPICYEIKPGS